MSQIDDGNGTVIVFSDDMEWTDEFGWSPVEQSKEYTIGGSLIIQEGIKLAGRPITLDSGRDVFVERDVVTQLTDESSASAGKTYTLTLPDGRTKPVIFDHSRNPVDASSPKIFRQRSMATDSLYNLTIRFIEL